MTTKIRDDYRKFDELLDLIKQMSRPINGLCYQEICEILHCSRKTAERAIKFISERFPDAFYSFRDPLNPKIFRFRLESADGLPPEYLSTDEMIALNVAIKQIKNESISEPLISLEYKLNKMLAIKKPLKEINDLEGKILSRASISRPWPHIIIEPEVIKVLQRAVLSSCKITATYTTTTGDVDNYTLLPVGFLYGNSNDYLVAYKDKVSDPVRIFVLSQLKNIKIFPKERFNPGKFNISDYADKSFGCFHSEHGPYNVELCASKKIAPVVMRYTFHSTQKITVNKNGSLTIKFKADGLWEMAWYLFQWAGELVPIAPKELVDTYKNFLDKAQKSLK